MPGPYDAFLRQSPRVDETETPESVVIGARFRRGRLMAGLSQRQVAQQSGVSQSLISRFERGRCPGLATKRLIAIATALGPDFPFGCCPHDHRCAWSKLPANFVSQRSRIEALMAIARSGSDHATVLNEE